MRTVFGFALLFLAVLMVATPALAANDRCEVCLFEHDDYGGTKKCFSGDVANLAAHGLGNEVSSLKLFKAGCPDLRVTLHKLKSQKGGEKVFTSSSEYVGDDFNDKAMSLTFERGSSGSASDAPDCGVCVYENFNYGGDYACFKNNGGHTDLNDLDPKFANKISSIRFFKDQCPDLDLTIYKKKNYQGDHKVLRKNVKQMAADWNDNISSLKLWSAGNGASQADANDCKVCFYEHTNYAGERECSTYSDLDALKNKASSVRLFTHGCPNLAVALYNKDDEKGAQFVVREDMPSLPADFNDKVKSIGVYESGISDPKKCGICLYENWNYKGEELCLSLSVGDLKDMDFADKASSIRFYNETCPRLSVMVFDMNYYRSADMNLELANTNWLQIVNKFTFDAVDWQNVHEKLQQKKDKGARIVFTDVPKLTTLNDEISSVLFGISEDWDMPQDPRAITEGCGVCLYQEDNFVSSFRCLVKGDNSMDGDCDETWGDDDLCPADRPVNSVLFITDKCPDAKLTLYTGKEYKGREVVLEDSVVDLDELDMGGGHVRSAIFHPKGKNAEVDPWKDCGVCLHALKDFEGKKVCFDKSVKDLDNYEFDNLASSVGLLTSQCPNLVVELFEKDDYKGKSRLIKGTLGSLGQVLDDKISSVKLYKDGADGPWNHTGGCGFCLFEYEAFTGEWKCFSGDTETNLGSNMAGKASSVWVDTSKCPKGKLTLYNKSGRTGQWLSLRKSLGDMSKFLFNNKARSVEFQSVANKGSHGDEGDGPAPGRSDDDNGPGPSHDQTDGDDKSGPSKDQTGGGDTSGPSHDQTGGGDTSGPSHDQGG